jgi:hypothetical protein
LCAAKKFKKCQCGGGGGEEDGEDSDEDEDAVVEFALPGSASNESLEMSHAVFFPVLEPLLFEEYRLIIAPLTPPPIND